MEKLRENIISQSMTRLEKILTDLEIEYKQVNSDDDLIYIANIYMDLLPDKNIPARVLLLYSSDNKDMFVMCPNIYKLKVGDTTLRILVALNKVNSKLSGGTVTLEEDKTIVYKRLVHFERTDSLNKLKLENIFNDVMASIIYTAEAILNTGELHE